jgi:hypothetical protein
MMFSCSNIGNDGQAVDPNESSLSDGTTLHGVLVAAQIVRGCSPTLSYNDLPRNPAEDRNRRTASADGDVQAGDIDANQRLDQRLCETVDLARVLHVFAAHRGG